MAPSIQYLIPPGIQTRMAAQPFGDLSVRPLVKLFDPTGIACWLVGAVDGDRLFVVGDLGLGEPEPTVVSHAFLSTLVGPTGKRLRCNRQFDRRWTMDTWVRVARRTGSIVAAEVELAKAGEALALSRSAAFEERSD